MAFTMSHTFSSSSYAAEKEKVLLGRSTQQPLLRQDFVDHFDGAEDDSWHDSHSAFSSHLALSNGTRLTAKSAGKPKLERNNRNDLPVDHEARDLAYILRTTGPEDGIFSQITAHKQPWPRSKGTFRLFSRGSKKRNHRDLVFANNESNHRLYDVGGLALPAVVEQKVSLTGKRYLALKLEEGESKETQQRQKLDEVPKAAMPLPRKSSLHEERVSGFSAALVDDIPTADKYDRWLSQNAGGRTSPVSPISVHKTETGSIRSRSASPQPDRRAAPPHYVPPPPRVSEPRTVLAGPPYMPRSGLAQHPTTDTMSDIANFDDAKYQVPRIRKPVTPMPNLALPREEFPVRVPRLDKECDIKHPSPRRFASHPVLRRRSSLSDTIQTRSDDDSPATPPPKSPLRLRRDNRLVERPIDTICQISIPEHATSPNKNPGIATPDVYARMPRITAVVTTQCTGPLSRQKSRDSPATSRRDREERIRARKLRDRPLSLLRHADAALNAALQTSPQRRPRKSRPKAIISSPRQSTEGSYRESISTRQSMSPKVLPGPLLLSTPELKPAPLNTKASPAANTPSNRSSNFTVSTPISLAYTGESAGMSPRSMMLVAEEVSLPKAKSPFRPAKIVVAKERVYTPRPRSASMPRSTPFRRSQTSITLPSRVLTPEMPKDQSATPPLPSPPPNRALPPTPPASGSERLRKRSCKVPAPRTPSGALPALPTDAGIAVQAASRQYTPQAKMPPKSEDDQLRARLEALESRNKLLEEAVLAMLNANGAASGFASAVLQANLASSLIGTGQSGPVDTMAGADMIEKDMEALFNATL